jgi:hypothetical protein
MPALEVASWAEFEADFGPITIHERLDAVIAYIAYTSHASAGGKEPPERFTPRWRRPMRWNTDQLLTWLGAEAKRGYD